jgi:DNA-binding transcriptional regulator YhcF (GntR family)
MVARPSTAPHDGGVRIRLDPSSRVPLSAQLRDALAAGIERGRPGPGERVPPVRELALELGLAPNTVARAYRELERAGLLEGRGRRGTFVTDRLPDPAEGRLADAAEAYARRARQLRVPDEEALRAVRGALRRRPEQQEPRRDAPRPR